MNPGQCEFLAENEDIKIIPNFNENQLHLISGDVGPFEAGMPVTVPLWLAVYLKRRHKCSILLPDWLCPDELRRMLADETAATVFTPIPEHFLELAHVLLRVARDEIDEADQLRTLVQDLWDRRVAKMRTSCVKFLEANQSSFARLDHLTQMEVTYSRALITEATKNIDRLQETVNRLAEQ